MSNMALWHGLLIFFLSSVVLGRIKGSEIKNEICKNTGFRCSSNCSQVEYCPKPDGVPIIVESCSDGNFCNTTTSDCSARICTNAPPVHAIKCSDFGLFPDPYNCSIGYYCEAGDVSPMRECECPAGYFDVSGSCVETKECCRQDAVKCDYAGQKGGFGPDCYEKFYYVCVASNNYLQATLFRCPFGTSFDESAGDCVDGERQSYYSSISVPTCWDYQSPDNNNINYSP